MPKSLSFWRILAICNLCGYFGHLKPLNDKALIYRNVSATKWKLSVTGTRINRHSILTWYGSGIKDAEWVQVPFIPSFTLSCYRNLESIVLESFFSPWLLSKHIFVNFHTEICKFYSFTKLSIYLFFQMARTRYFKVSLCCIDFFLAELKSVLLYLLKTLMCNLSHILVLI